MDLYEALKEGTSVEDLTAAFMKDLGAACDRIDEEKKKEETEKKELLSIYRNNLAVAINDYCQALLGEDDEILSIEEMEEMFISFEKEIDVLLSLVDGFKKPVNSKDKKGIKITYTKDDDDIIDAFLKTLK